MPDTKKMLTIHSTLSIPADALETIVGNAKKITGRNEKGYYRVDTADMVSEMISRFLLEKDFISWAEDLDNYA